MKRSVCQGQINIKISISKTKDPDQCAAGEQICTLTEGGGLYVLGLHTAVLHVYCGK